MAETILKGYLLNKTDFQVFDEIIVFLADNGKKYSCISLGSRKIESKNSRNLFYGIPLEFEFFEARSFEKVSKLKKVHSLEQVDWNLQSNKKLLFLNELILNVNQSIELYQYYESKIKQIKENKEDEQTFILITLREFCKLSGIMLQVNSCVICNSNILKTISFKHNGMLCNECCNRFHVIPQDIRFSKLINLLFNDKYDKINIYYDLFGYAIKMLKQYIFDVAGIKLISLKEY